MPPRHVPISERFDRYVIKTDVCWLWTGATNTGYGRMRVLGRDVWAHRAAWELANGCQVTALMQVCHSCDVRNCVRPDHLFLGTATDNKHDAMRKQRHAFGRRHPHAKLTDEIVRTVRARWNSGQSIKSLAREYGVSRRVVALTVRRLSWRHVA